MAALRRWFSYVWDALTVTLDTPDDDPGALSL